MGIIEIKSDLHDIIDKINDLSTLNALKVLLSKKVEAIDFWDELPERQKESIDRGLEQADKGALKEHNDVMKKYSEWL